METMELLAEVVAGYCGEATDCGNRHHPALLINGEAKFCCTAVRERFFEAMDVINAASTRTRDYEGAAIFPLPHVVPVPRPKVQRPESGANRLVRLRSEWADRWATLRQASLFEARA